MPFNVVKHTGRNRYVDCTRDEGNRVRRQLFMNDVPRRISASNFNRGPRKIDTDQFGAIVEFSGEGPRREPRATAEIENARGGVPPDEIRE
jgi:hypothetical protein